MIYTRQGDEGQSSLGHEKLDKSDIRFELLGNVDELSSFIGLAKAKLQNESYTDYIAFTESIQANLSLISAGIFDNSNDKFILSKKSVFELEAQIDYMQSVCPTEGFVLTGGCELSACLDVCRSVARRTERSFCAAKDDYRSHQILVRPETLMYLNRLSDFFFTFARYADYLSDIENAVKNALSVLRTDAISNEFSNITFDYSLQHCKLIAKKIEERASGMNLGVAIAFCDASGNPFLAYSTKDALIVSFDYAIKKAYTAVALKMPTKQAQELTQPGQMFYGLNDERLLLIPGGMPIVSGDSIIGGLGVSGGSGSQDMELSGYGASLFSQIHI